MKNVKRIATAILVVALGLCDQLLDAQNVHQGEVFELNKSLNSHESHKYTASNYIELKKGFYSDPDSTNSTLLHLDLEGYAVFPPEEGLTNSNGCVVGTLGGTFNVSAMGGLLYSIPLELPKGINGMQPNLAITYNSQAGGGLLGWGWDLSGLSCITRTGQTLYYDGKKTAADLSWNDRLLLDEKRLVTVADYTDSIEFRLEQDEMSKIMAYIRYEQAGLMGYGTIKVLDHFIVWKADGLVLEYGTTADSWIDPQNGGNAALCWQLSKVSDRNGNSMVYHYHEDQNKGRNYLRSIEYTMNDSQETSAQFVISFEYYLDGGDYEQFYINGNRILFRQRLTSILISSKIGSKPVFKYDFTYLNPSSNRYYSRLSNIEMTSYDASGATESFNQTTINWSETTPSDFVMKTIANSELFDDFTFTGDFNGDGYTDVATVPYKDSTEYEGPVDIVVYLNNRSGDFVEAPTMRISNLPVTLDWVFVIDINGDGLDDIVPYFNDVMPTKDYVNTIVRIYLNNANNHSFDYVGQKLIPSNGDVAVGDFDGNGVSDVILFQKKDKAVTYDNNDPVTMPFIENVFHIGMQGSQLEIRQLNSYTLETLGPVFNIVAADFNGDGISELLLVGLNRANISLVGTKIVRINYNDGFNSFHVLQYFNQNHLYYEPTEGCWSHIFPGDFNGDGKTDLLFNKNGWYLCFSEGEQLGECHAVNGSCLPNLNAYVNLFYPSLMTVQHSGTNQQMFSVSVCDFNGDGYDDVGFTTNTESGFYIDSRIVLIQQGTQSFKNKIRTTEEVHFRSQYIHVGNFLGKDNVSCLALVSNNGMSSVKICSPSSSSEFNSVTSITDGLGNTTHFDYDYLTPASSGNTDPFYSYTYAAPDTNGVQPKPLGVRALKTITMEGVNNSKLISKYHYQNAMVHKDGHGFIGFGLTSVETYRNSLDSLWTTKKDSFFEKNTMGRHAMLLPHRDISYVNCGEMARVVNRTEFGFEKVILANGLTNLVVCPAMVNKAEELYSMDEDDELTTTISTSYEYNYNNNHTYNNAYGCIYTAQRVMGYDHRSPVRELQTEKRIQLYTNETTWIVNRPVRETVTRGRNEDFSSTLTEYSYISSASYQPQSITVIPNDGTQSDDPLTVSTSYDYDGFGNVIEQQVDAPNGIHDETPRLVSYEYGWDYQHRLPTKETRGGTSDGYFTQYEYEFHDRLASSTDCNGKRMEFKASIFGTDIGVFPCDGTEQRTQTLWADKSPYRPSGASYYTWSKKTGGVTSMTFYHKSGVELRNVTFDFNGTPVYVDKKYNAKGLLEGESAPYKKGESWLNVQWTLYDYDIHDRIKRIEYPDGSTKVFAYNGLETTTTVTPPLGGSLTPSQTTVSKTNSLGWFKESIDANGTSIYYEYYPDGNLKWTRVGNDENTTISMEYDHAGNRTRIHDPDYCTNQKDLVSEYNAFGEEVSRTTPREYVTTFTYDDFGRMTEQNEEEEVEPGVTEIRYTSWCYNETVPQKGLLMNVSFPGQTVQYEYDTCQRLAKEIALFTGGERYETSYAYDRASRIASVIHPSGVMVNYQYNNLGYSKTQTDGCGIELYRTKRTTPMGQAKQFVIGGVLTSTMEYDSLKHLLTRTITQKSDDTIQDFLFSYDGFCNLASRKDNRLNLEETFTYDNQNRLTEVWLGTTQTGMSAYDSYGRMTAKIADGTPVFFDASFSMAKPHAMGSATTSSGVFPIDPQTVTYTGFDKVRKIKQGVDSLCYTYGYDHQRIFMEEQVDNKHRTKRYVGNCEYITETNGNVTDTQWLTYLTGPTGVYAVVMTKSGTDQVFYVLKDNLGSWTTITDEHGNVAQQLSYDAWGNLRNPNTWSGSFNGTPLFDRGFTEHEHLYNFGLINMNGRMYDPVMSSFLSVDQYVQSPENAQGFNRYAYCMNNPLRYIDPSGWRHVGGQTGYTPNSADFARDPYAYADSRGWEPRDFGLRELSTSDPVVTWMEENKLHGGGRGGSIETKGGWYKSGDEIRWNPSISSQDDLDNLGIIGKYLGHSYIDKSKQMYYSLLGYMIDMNQGGGIAGRIAPLIDEAFINYEEFRKELVLLNKSYGDEQQQKWTDFINIIEYDYNRGGLQEYCFFLGPIECHFFVGKTENSMKARIEHVDLTKTRPDSNNGYGIVKWSSGYDINFVSKASYYDSNPRNSRTVVLIIPQSHWNSFKTRYNSVFPFKP